MKCKRNACQGDVGVAEQRHNRIIQDGPGHFWTVGNRE